MSILLNRFSSMNIEDIGKLNGLAGGLAGSAVTYGMTGSATFNLASLNFMGKNEDGELVPKQVGLFELTYSKAGGFSSRLGMGGQDVSLGTIASAVQGAGHWNTNNKIQNYVSKNGLDKGDFLRMNYGFGDDKAKDQLDSILDGSTHLEFGGTDGKAQTVLEGDKRVVQLNDTKNLNSYY